MCFVYLRICPGFTYVWMWLSRNNFMLICESLDRDLFDYFWVTWRSLKTVEIVNLTLCYHLFYNIH